MLRIRLRRGGKKNQPFYRIVVANHHDPVKGGYIAKIGHYNPLKKALVLDKEAALDWMNKGAKPSNTVAKLFKKQAIEHQSIVIKLYKTKSKVEIEKEKQAKELEKQQEAEKKEASKAEFEAKVEKDKQEAEAANVEKKPAEENKPVDKTSAETTEKQ